MNGVLHTLGWHHTSGIETFYLLFFCIAWPVIGFHCIGKWVEFLPSMKPQKDFCGPQTQWWAEKESFFWTLEAYYNRPRSTFRLASPHRERTKSCRAASWPCIRSSSVMQPSGRLPSAGDSRLARALLLTNSPHVQVFHYNFWNKTSMLTFLDVGFGPVEA